MIYFDNAATGGYKPNSVLNKVFYTLKNLNANAGRSGHKLSKIGAEIIYEARKKLSAFFNNEQVDRVVFTKNCSEALNIAIYGLVKHGDHVITTVTEHNSVLRPLYTLQQNGVIQLSIVKPYNKTFITKTDIKSAFKQNTKLVVVNYASNVTGTVNDISGIGHFLKNTNATFLVDGAQASGHIKIDMKNSNIDALSVAGHKGLYAIQGIGALIFNEKTQILDTFQGGTGTETFSALQPTCYPERLEYGTLNLPAISSLLEGVKYVEKGVHIIAQKLLADTSFLINALKEIDGVKVYSNKNECGIVSFSVENTPSSEVSEILSSKYDICVRGGFHCAPLMHEFLNSKEEGLTRVSLCPHNTREEIYAFIKAVKEIAGKNSTFL
ncbi:MAG: aminotransferase class V-fold PLP-dependent enzyme [Clostridia bacterium]|nr:aminotransferase class V-fold PLP-dependent enzyme [Clostridia bacterium]